MKSILLLAMALIAAAPVPRPSTASTAVDPALVLPPFPEAGSAQAQAELVELHASSTDPAKRERSEKEGKTKDPSIFVEVLGPRFDLAHLPATAQLFEMLRTEQKAVVDRGKDEFKRPRPWIADPTITPCSRGEDPLSSYPSGHATNAFSMAGLLARLVPERAADIMARAAHYGELRILCAQHFRSDVTAGEALGLLLAERLLATPRFQAAFQAARAELVAKGLAKR